MKRTRVACLYPLLCLLGLGLSDTARVEAATLSATPLGINNSITFTGIPAGNSSTQQLTISTDTPTTVVLDIAPTTPQWLSTSPSNFFNITPQSTVTLNVTVNTSGLNPGTYTNTFTIGLQGSANPQFTVTVSLTVAPGTQLSASPSSMSFSATQGALVGTPQAIPVLVSSSGAQLNYTLTTNTTDGNHWLLTSPSCTLIAPCTTGGSGFNVSVDPAAAGLTPSVTPYQGSIVAQSTSTSDSATINVTFTFSANATLTVTPTTLPAFLYQIGSGTTQPTQQSLSVSSTGSVPFTVGVSPAVPWLVLGTTSGVASPVPTNVALNINPAGLPTTPGSSTTSLSFVPATGSAPQPVNVTLVSSNNALLKLTNNALAFTAIFAGPKPTTQQITLSSTGAAVGFTTTADPTATWLTVSSSSTTASAATPAALIFNVDSVNPAILATGNYTATILVHPNNGDPYSLPVTVSLGVSSPSQITAGPPLLHFSYEATQQSPGTQLIQLGSTGQPVQFTLTSTAAATANCPANWIQAGASSNTTPVLLTVGVLTPGMTAGTCTGTVVVTPAAGSGGVALNIPITVDISVTAELNIGLAPGFGVQTIVTGAAASTFGINLTSTNSVNQVTFTATSNVPWLAVAPTQLTSTPQTLLVVVSPSSPSVLTPGIYNGAITITSVSLPSGTVSIPYTLTVNPNINVSVTPPNSLTFTQPQNGPSPAAQTLSLAAAGGAATYTAQVNSITGGNWLKVNSSTSTSGTVNPSTTLNVSVDPAVSNVLGPPNTSYTSQVLLTFPGTATGPITITVNLTITEPQTVTVTPTLLQFTFQAGGAVPGTQNLSISSTGGAVNFNVTTTSNGGWLGLDTTSGATPKQIKVGVDPSKVPAGTPANAQLTGTIAIAAPGVLANPLIVNVTLSLLPIAAPQLTTISSSASLAFGPIAPGELITIKGTNLAPSTPTAGVSYTINGLGGVNSTLNSVQVTFDTIAGIPTFVSPTQINVIVPYSIAGRLSTKVKVINQGIESTEIIQSVAAVAPGLFTLTADGKGQALVYNVADGNINGLPGSQAFLTTPATQGSFIVVYATGGGQTSPASTDGSVNPRTAVPLIGWTPTSGTVTATIGGKPALVTYAGQAPTFVNGVIQFNIQVPTGLLPGSYPIIVTVNGVPTPTNAGNLGPNVAVQ